MEGLPQDFDRIKGIKLNIGCGGTKMTGFINIDRNRDCNPDIIRDVEKGLPFSDNTVSMILCTQLLEHLTDIVFVMNEFHRVLKPKGRLYLSVPLLTGKWAFIDPTHKRLFTEESFDFYINRDYGSETAGVTGWFKVKYKQVHEHSLYLILEAIK